MVCPGECAEDRKRLKESINKNFGILEDLYMRSIPSWARAIFVVLIGVLFVFCGWIYMDSTKTFATKVEVRQLQLDIKEDIKSGFQIQRTDFKNFISELKKAK